MLKKIMLVTLGIVLVLLLGGFVLVNLKYDRTFDAPFPNIKASKDSAVIARGRYLVYGPAHCAHCHSQKSDYQNVDKGLETSLKGGYDFVLPIGNLYAPNITPDVETGIGKYSDGEIARSLRYGIRHDGRAIIDIMPFYELSDEDLTAIISYLRSIEPVKNKRPENNWNLMGKIALSFMIKPTGDGNVEKAPPIDSTAAYGKYIASSIANCRGCHSERDLMTGAYVGKEFSGGQTFEVIDRNGNTVKGKHMVTPNLTFDKATGRMSDWSKEDFINRFRKGKIIEGSIMPWGPYSRMSDIELTALYKFFSTLEPVNKKVPLGIQKGDPL